MSLAAVANDVIMQEVSIKAPADRIFDALTTPAELFKWWTVAGKYEAVQVEGDLRPGGKWLMVMKGCGGTATASAVTGEYREIVRPNLLTYTWVREDGIETLVRWDLKEVAGVTTVRVTHSGLVTDEMKARNNGWPMVLDLLTAWVE